MPDPDFRALCAELLQLELEQPAEYTDWKWRYNAAMARTRAALAEPELCNLHREMVAESVARRARRPKPPSLADQATAELDDAVMRGDCITTTDAMPLLRAALKRLAELEALPD